MPSRHLHAETGLDNVLNFRDVGKTVNAFLGKRLLREGLLYRSARPDDASLGDRKRLRDEYGIKTVMDLRTKTEHLNQAKKRQADLRVPALVRSNAALAEPVQIPGLRYLEIRVTGRDFERFLLGQLCWWSLVKVIFLFIVGLRMRAIAIIGREVMQPRGLVGLGLDTLDHCGAPLCEALGSIVEPSGTPVVVHCTQGKDRTGVVVMLVLMALGVPLPAIDHDYMLSDEELVPEKEARLVEILEIGLTKDFGDTAPDMTRKTAKHLDVKYGGIEAYLDHIGFGQTERQRLDELLLY